MKKKNYNNAFCKLSIYQKRLQLLKVKSLQNGLKLVGFNVNGCKINLAKLSSEVGFYRDFHKTREFKDTDARCDTIS